MKVLFVCALILAGAFVVKGAHELCGLDNDQINTMLKCMAEGVDSVLTDKAKEILTTQGENLAEVLKKQCEAEVDFGELLKKFFSEEEAEAITKVYNDCKPGAS